MTTRKSAKSSPTQTPKSDAPKGLSKFQAFEVRRLHRREIKKADYNPRIIGAKEKRRLQAILEKLRLLQPLVWNELTGNLVSGHQRITIIDALEGTDDYELDFSVVRLSEDEEKQANIALNNESAMGQWDTAGLSRMLESMAKKAGDMTTMLAGTGFDAKDLALILPSTSGLFALAEATDAKSPLVAEIQAVQDDAGDTEERNLSTNPFRELGAKSKKPQATAWRPERDEDTENYAVLTFASRAKREEFMVLIGLGEDERYADGADVVKLLGG